MICMVQTNIGRQCLCANGPSFQEVLTNSQRSAVTQTSQLAGSLFANKCQRMMASVVSLKMPKDLQWEDRFIITEELIWNTITVEKGSVSVAMRFWPQNRCSYCLLKVEITTSCRRVQTDGAELAPADGKSISVISHVFHWTDPQLQNANTKVFRKIKLL